MCFLNTEDSKENKLRRGGSMFGKYANIAMETIDSDIIIMLCDDDALIPDYLFNLNVFI